MPWTTGRLTKAQEMGAVIVVIEPAYEGMRAYYSPRHVNDREPWRVEGLRDRVPAHSCQPHSPQGGRWRPGRRGSS